MLLQNYKYQINRNYRINYHDLIQTNVFISIKIVGSFRRSSCEYVKKLLIFIRKKLFITENF